VVRDAPISALSVFPVAGPHGKAGLGWHMGDPFRSDPLADADLRAVLSALLEKYLEFLAARDRSDLLAERVELILRTLVDSINENQLNRTAYLLRHPGRERPPLSPARCLRISRHADGWATIRIDTEKPFRLSPSLSDFLEHLASDEAASDDSLVAWKSRASLWEWLRKHSGRGVGAKYVNKRVSDLRTHLENAGIERDLVQTHRRKGVRFALRRSPGASPNVVGSVRR